MKTIVITGVNKGIGKALCDKFASLEWIVIGTYVGDKPSINSENVRLISLDLSSPKSIERCASIIPNEVQKIDALINNAGVMLDPEDTEIDIEKLRQTLEINLIGTIDFTERLLDQLAENGNIINISSAAGSLTDMNITSNSRMPGHYPAYKISKCALNMYTRELALRMQTENKKITVSSINPGWVKTDMGGLDAPLDTEEVANDIYEFTQQSHPGGDFWYKGNKYPW